ncbi:MAG TPA: hypothetical protein VIQ31_26710 [Phormidium sp.]
MEPLNQPTRSHIPNPNGNPEFKPKWKTLPTEAIRIPSEFKSILLELARALDEGRVNSSQIDSLFNARETEQNESVMQ